MLSRRSVLLAPVLFSADPADDIAAAVKAGGGVAGVFAKDLPTGRTTGWNPDRPFPMQSVFKLPIGVAVLDAVDRGRLRLDQEVTITPADNAPGYVAFELDAPRVFRVRELLRLMVSQSDNTACDVLLRLVGGPHAVTSMLKRHGIEGVRVDRPEREMALDYYGIGRWSGAWSLARFRQLRDAVPPERRRAVAKAYAEDPRDTATPRSCVDLLEKLHKETLLSPASTKHLLQLMIDSPTGRNRLRALLPPEVSVAHKTGTGDDTFGVNAATNDVGLLGRKVAVAVFIKSSPLPLAARERAIAETARRVWHAWQ